MYGRRASGMRTLPSAWRLFSRNAMSIRGGATTVLFSVWARYLPFSPYAGDRVRIEVDANDEGYVQEILPRKNFLVRPPLANLDKLFVVSSVCDPQPSTLIIDKTIAAAELKGIEPVLVFTKTDLSDTTELKDIYGSIGIRCYFVSSADGVGVDDLRPELTGCISAFTGNSGVGKSTLLNLLVPKREYADRCRWGCTRYSCALRPQFLRRSGCNSRCPKGSCPGQSHRCR